MDSNKKHRRRHVRRRLDASLDQTPKDTARSPVGGESACRAAPRSAFESAFELLPLEEELPCERLSFCGPPSDRAAAGEQAWELDPARSAPERSPCSPVERRRTLVEWNATRTDYPIDATIHELFEAEVRRSPDVVAASLGAAEITYGELNRRANRLARRLIARGVGLGVPVGILVERSLDMLVGLLGILKAGGAYLPLDPDDPPERLRFMLEDTGAPVLLARRALSAALPFSGKTIDFDGDGDGDGDLDPACGASASDLAYIIFTSGSTGRPKGVAVNHRGVVRLVRSTDYIDLGPSDRVAHASNLAFDASTFEIWGALLNGARVVLIPEDNLLSLDTFAATLRDEGITAMFLTTALFNQVVSTCPGALKGLKHLLFGGEACDPRRVREALLRGAPERLLHVYGPTENTTFSTWHLVREVAPGALTVPIGRPIANTRAYILDSNLEPVPAGAIGELYLGGDGLARGYVNRPELTAERFLRSPLPEEPGTVLYKTGDRARYLPDGAIEFVGRTDDQVKIRGFRIEPGEVEVALREHPNVQQAVVLAREDVPGEKRLVAYVVPARDELFSRLFTAELRRFLKQRLPEHMVPSAIELLGWLPLTPNGKVDRRALPAPSRTREALDVAYAAPRSPVEEVLADIWADALGVDRVGVHDNFLELGGHSLLATRILSRARESLQASLTLKSFFEAPTVAALASCIEEARGGPPALAAQPIPSVTRHPGLPLSFAQRQIWLAARMDPQSPRYNEPVTLRFAGALDIAALERSINEILRRHEGWRTTFGWVSGEPVQVIHPHAAFTLPALDLTAMAAGRREGYALKTATDEARRPFDLSRGPLFRATLMKLDKEDFRLYLTLHHTVVDGVSLFGIFLRELNAFYGSFSRGEPLALPALPVQYADFAAWQRGLFTREALAPQLAYWRDQLKGLPTLNLPADRPRPATATFRGGRRCLSLPRTLVDSLKALARREGCTLFMTLLAAFKALLYRYSGQDDIAVGTVASARERYEVEAVLGNFLNTLVLRTRVAPEQSFRELLSRVREVTLGAYANQDIPFERLVEELRPDRSSGQNPLFQVAFVLEPSEPAFESRFAASQLDIETGTSKFDLTLELDDKPDGMVGRLEYSADLFDAATIDRMIEHYRTLLEGIARAPERPVMSLPLLTGSEKRALAAWNATTTEYPRGACVHELFDAQAERSPSAVALIMDGAPQPGGSLTYRELHRRSNQLAHYLRKTGLEPGSLVGVCMDRSLEMVVALLAILKAGGVYVPLDPAYPKERLAFMIEDTRAPVLLTQPHLKGSLPESGARVLVLDSSGEAFAEESTESPPCVVAPEDLVYVMYTSGSTGTPKGVSAVHRGVVRLVKGTTYADFNEREVFLQLAPTSFDASTLEIWGALLNGARLVIMANGATSLQGIGQALRRHGVTTLWLTAGLFHLMVDEELDSLRGLRQLLSGGDVLSVSHVRRALSELKGCRLINGYGPTENTTFTCCYPMTDPEQVGASVPIGRPISNTQVYLLDAHMQPVPIGVPGELYTGGDGLARGYFNRPELTAERFVRSPFGGPGERLYRTGDLARYRADGAIEFLGRIDAQVKIRGYRVEPGEIESALMQHPGVRDAVVVARGDTVAGKRLVAYVVPARGQEPPEPRALKEHLKARLPDPMIPSAYVLLEGLPLNANGKPDRRALPDPEAAEGGGAEEQTAPRDEMELWIASVWKEVLGAEGVGTHDNFFDVGGNSLLMARVHTKLNKAGGEEVSMVDLFTYPTVSALARYLKNKRSGSPQQGRLARVRSNDHGPARTRRARAGRQHNG